MYFEFDGGADIEGEIVDRIIDGEWVVDITTKEGTIPRMIGRSCVITGRIDRMKILVVKEWHEDHTLGPPVHLDTDDIITIYVN